MMMTLRPMSVTSIESPPAAIDPVGPCALTAFPTGQRKRIKSAGDGGNRITTDTGCVSLLEVGKESGKKTFLSMFKSKSKTIKVRSSDKSSSSTSADGNVANTDSAPTIENPSVTCGSGHATSRSEDGAECGTAQQPSTKTDEVSPMTSSFALKKGFQRSISISSSASNGVKKDTKSGNTFHPGDGYEDFPCKFDCPPTPVKLSISKTQPAVENAGSPSFGEVVQALSGPPLDNKPEDPPMPSSGNDDRSPLIDRDPSTEKLAAIAATSFDNIASVTETDQPQQQPQPSTQKPLPIAGTGSGGSGNTSPSSTTTKSAVLPTGVFFTGNGNAPVTEKPPSSSVSWWSSSKGSSGIFSGKQSTFGASNGSSSGSNGKKRKPRLSIMLPSSSSSKDSGGMRQLSASEERKIDEAMQLASHMARLCANDHAALPSPRSISGSSKESLESPATSTTSFFGGFRRRIASEKRTFADGLQASLSIDAAERMFTPDAQAAYNQLVASSPPATGSDSVTTKAPSGRRHEIRTHRFQLLDAPVPRHHQRSSLSESDQGLVAAVIVPVAFQFPAERRPSNKRSVSLSDDAPTFHIEMTTRTPSAAASDSTLSPSSSTSVANATAGDRASLTKPNSSCRTDDVNNNKAAPKDDDDTVPEQRAPTPPPKLPPRAPLRPSTVNAKPRQRRHPLASTAACSAGSSSSSRPHSHHPYRQSSVGGKLRSASEAMQFRSPPPLPPPTTTMTARSKPSTALDVVLPRRVTRSTADADDADLFLGGRRVLSSSAGSDASGSGNHPLNVTHASSSSSDDSSVFAADRNNDDVDDDGDNDPPPTSPAPLPPRGGLQQPLIFPRAVVGCGAARPLQPRLTAPEIWTKARDLGLEDDRDAFWSKPIDFRQISGGALSTVAPLSCSEEDLLDQLIARPTPGRYDTSDAVSYEDLMEFALDGPNCRKPPPDESECDEVRLMRKLLSKDVTVKECVDALSDTRWDVYNAIKLIKLNKLLNTGLADEQLCKQALMACSWNVEQAAAYLLSPPPSDS